jgi:hypothetical protein
MEDLKSIVRDWTWRAGAWTALASVNLGHRLTVERGRIALTVAMAVLSTPSIAVQP